MKLRSHCLADMAKQEVTTVSHSVTNFKSALTPFAGRINGELTQPLEVFIDSLESHFVSKSLIDGKLQLRESRQHLDLVRGDLGAASRNKAFKRCETWDDLKGFLRDRYSSSKTQNIVTFFRSIFKLLDRKGDSYWNQSAKLNDSITELVKRMNTSNWVDVPAGTKADANAISLDKVETLLLLAFGLGTLPDELVGHFDADFNHTNDENLILNQIEKHITKMQCADRTILDGKKSEKQCPKQIASTNGSGRNQSSNRTKKNEFRCFNCNRVGHMKKDCNVKYCGLHKTKSHSWRDCYSQKRGRSRARDNRSSDDSSNRDRSQSSYRDSDQSRAAGMNETVNQSKECVNAQNGLDFRQGQDKMKNG